MWYEDVLINILYDKTGKYFKDKFYLQLMASYRN